MQPIYRTEDNELMGFIVESSNSKNLWIPLSVFKIKIGMASSKDDAINFVLANGLQILTEKWEYFDESSNEWKICLILEANPDYVKIQEGIYPEKDAKVLNLKNPTGDQVRLHDLF